MPQTAPAFPTRALIESREIVENQFYDFKQKLDLDNDRSKAKFIDDVVAFLNAGPGHLIIGVAEEKGKGWCSHLEPLEGNRDELERRLLSIIQSNIDPMPLKVSIAFIDVDDRFLVDIRIPKHGRRPYQNKLTGGFMIRTGGKNTPVARDEVHALFTNEERFEADVAQLLDREDRRLEERRLMDADGSTFHLGIVPLEHYDRSMEPFAPGTRVRKGIRLFHDRAGFFQGCEDGVEAREVWAATVTRLFISDDWLVHACVAFPFDVDRGGDRVTIYEFKDKLASFLKDIADFLSEEGIEGPFCMMMAVRNLHRDPKVAWAFPTTEQIALRRGVMTERIDDPDLIERFYQMVYRGSRYGGAC